MDVIAFSWASVRRRSRPFGLLLVLLLVLPGCGGGDDSVSSVGASGSGPGAAGSDRLAGSDTEPVQPPPAWSSPLELAADHLNHARLDAAQEQLQAAESSLSESAASDDKSAGVVEWKALTARLVSAREAERQRLAAENASKRSARLSEAQELQESGKLDEATAALDGVLSMAPTAEQREIVRRIAAAIEAHRSARRRLGSWMKMLGSKQRSEVRAAQNQLRRDPDTAIPLLLEAVRSLDQPQLVKNTLELLRRLKRPGLAVPAMVGVLSRAGQESSWPDAVREISRLKDPGAGPLLLPLLAKAKSPAHRAAVLMALSDVIDPPPDTLPVLLETLFTDGKELEPALRAAYTAMSRHGQDDLVALRGLPAQVDQATAELLIKLPVRLVELSALSKPEQATTARAAKRLAVLIGVIEPAAFVGVQVVSSVGQYDDSPAAAVVDGKWDAETLQSGWRHPLGKPGTIILDLGSEKTVTAIRVWNYNGSGQRDRGWKEVDVFVANSRTDLTPETSGIIPRAPGTVVAAGAPPHPDFSIQLPVDQVQGRYVILKAKSLWVPSSFAGLAEIQVIGY